MLQRINSAYIENGMAVARHDCDPQPTIADPEWESWADENIDEARKLHDAYFGENGLDVGDAMIALARNPQDKWAVKTLAHHAYHLREAREARMLQIGPSSRRTVKCGRCGERTFI